MAVIVSSIFTIFLNKREANKVLAWLLIIYVSCLKGVEYLQIATTQDYINIYTVLTLGMIFGVVVLSGRKILHVIISTTVIAPQLYYLLILYKPYLLLSNIPLWWVLSVDQVFTYSVFFMLYEQANDLSNIPSLAKLSFKDYILNALIWLSLFLL